MPVELCGNCEHPVKFHGMESCRARYAVSDPPCGCPMHAGRQRSTLKQCPAEYRGPDGTVYRCTIMADEAVLHGEDHLGESGMRWIHGDPGWAGDVANPDRTQVGGDHYVKRTIQPWDVWEEYEMDPWRANALKYLMRAGDKGPALEDLKKARHYLDKCIEREERRG